MSPRKLTESDKKEILDLYRLPQETTSTLAERYSVSSSTISRFLKSRLAGDEYEELIQQKRLSRTPSGAAQVLSQYQEQKEHNETVEPTAIESAEPTESESPAEEREQPSEVQTGNKIRRSRRRRSSVSEPELQSEPKQLETLSPIAKPMPNLKAKESQQYFDFEEDETEVDVHALEEMLGEDLADLDDDLDEEDELDELDEGDWEREGTIPHLRSGIADINILPLSAANFPRNCYLVIDRAAELITRPLEAFSDLGDIPPEEFHQETLPVFDNHKIARRFSKRSQRVIKVPDSQIFQKAKTHLRSKGITRLLIDGQVYSLGRDES
ncbi:MAG: transposase [Cyanobacteria bacterium SBLK]|nr:transposase [Cyanobacteria bacterium SBLK]